MKKALKIVVFVPPSHAEIIREVMGEAGAGKIDNYSYCTFSSMGTGRFLPLKGAHPVVGKVGKLEIVKEEKIETVCAKSSLEKVLLAIKKVHPYEAPAIDVYPVEVV